jgi:hypothetical protein
VRAAVGGVAETPVESAYAATPALNYQADRFTKKDHQFSTGSIIGTQVFTFIG